MGTAPPLGPEIPPPLEENRQWVGHTPRQRRHYSSKLPQATHLGEVHARNPTAPILARLLRAEGEKALDGHKEVAQNGVA